MSDANFTVRLSSDEALVLFEWLANLDAKAPGSFSHPAEEKVVWKIEAGLEGVLTEPFKDNYRAILELARKRVMEERN